MTDDETATAVVVLTMRYGGTPPEWEAALIAAQALGLSPVDSVKLMRVLGRQRPTPLDLVLAAETLREGCERDARRRVLRRPRVEPGQVRALAGGGGFIGRSGDPVD